MRSRKFANLLLTLLFTIFVGGFLAVFNAWSQRPQVEQRAHCTLRDYETPNQEYLLRMVYEVKKRFPEVYQTGIKIGIDPIGSRFDVAWAAYKQVQFAPDVPKYQYSIYMDDGGFMMACEEDFLAVLVHEFTHIKLYKEGVLADTYCNNIKHELNARWAVIRRRHEIRQSNALLRYSVSKYRRKYLEALGSDCRPEIFENVPTLENMITLEE